MSPEQPITKESSPVSVVRRVALGSPASDGTTPRGLNEPIDRRANLEQQSIRKVLVATDFSPASAQAVEQAVEICNRLDARLTVLHVMDINAQPAAGQVGTAADLMKNLRAEGFTQMSHLAWSLCGKVEAQTTVQEGLPWEEIASQSRDFDLLVVGKRKRKMRWGLFSRNTAQRVIEHAACPVLVIPEPGTAPGSD
jgi:nucleotide-binding universal stress UspA family protein